MGAHAVAEAMRAIDRRWFLPDDQREHADIDAPLPIGLGQTNSQPRTVADMLKLLDVQPGQRVLDVGAGSGWSTALLAHLVGPTGRVIGVEIEPTIAEFGAANLARLELPTAELRTARPGVLGWPDDAPFDRVLVSANATSMPTALVDQLGPDGVMVAVVNSILVRVVLKRGGRTKVTRHGAYRFVPLR